MIHHHTFRILVVLLVLCFGKTLGISQEKQPPAFLVDHPELIQLKLLPRELELNEDPEALRAPYTTKTKIYFRLQATNSSLQKVTVLIIDPYFQNRPELFRDGQLVPYKEGVDQLLQAKDKDPFMRLVQHVNLEPNESKICDYLWLNNWYEQLQPGHYQLSVKHRFEPAQPWIDSSSITFDVTIKRENLKAAAAERHSQKLIFAPRPTQTSLTADQQDKNAVRSDPVVTTEIQPDAPLTITPKAKWFDEKTFEIYVVVKNVETKPITVYATTTLNLSLEKSAKTCFIHRFPYPGKMLTTNRTDGKSHWNGMGKDDQPPRLQFGLDFVEFSDGSTWGTDYCQAKEYLDALRSGLRAARTVFKSIVAQEGGEKLIEELRKGPMEIDVPTGHSAYWEKSFKSGVEAMRQSVLRAYQERGLPEIDIELSRPIDSSDSAEASKPGT